METENPQKEFLFYCWNGSRFAKGWPSFMAAQKTVWNPKQIWEDPRWIPAQPSTEKLLGAASMQLAPHRWPSLQVQCPNRLHHPSRFLQTALRLVPTTSSDTTAMAGCLGRGRGGSYHSAARHSMEFLQLPQVMPLPFSTWAGTWAGSGMPQ